LFNFLRATYRQIEIRRYIQPVAITAPDPVVLLKALADPGRLLIARVLAEGSFNVSELVELLGVGQSTVSRNLRILVRAGLLVGRAEGRLHWYAWATPLDPASATLRDWVADNGPPLDGEFRRRIHAIWETRRERIASFFATVDATDPAAAWLGSPDCLPELLSMVPDGATVVDLGTGTGRVLDSLAERAAKVIGIDASPSMLREARKRADAAGLDGIDLRLGDLAHLPVHDAEADAVIANMVLHHLPEPARAFPEIRRVLRPGGTLLIGDFLPHDQEWMREHLADQWLGLAPAEVRNWLDGAGFSAVDIQPIPPARPGTLGVFVARAVRP
jgi:SAM-dependent methyltransferase